VKGEGTLGGSLARPHTTRCLACGASHLSTRMDRGPRPNCGRLRRVVWPVLATGLCERQWLVLTLAHTGSRTRESLSPQVCAPAVPGLLLPDVEDTLPICFRFPAYRYRCCSPLWLVQPSPSGCPLACHDSRRSVSPLCSLVSSVIVAEGRREGVGRDSFDPELTSAPITTFTRVARARGANSVFCEEDWKNQDGNSCAIDGAA